MKIYFLSAITAFLISLLFCWVLIPILKRFRAGQNILVYVKEHQYKGGTPTMGGIAFITAAIFSAVLFIRRTERSVLITIVVGLAYMAIGLLDDFFKQRRKENLGLTAKQKFFFQTVVSILVGVYCLRAKLTVLQIPFSDITIDVGGWILPIVIFVFLATVNAVNLTDGLDGLAAGACAPFFLSIGILLIIQSKDRSFPILAFCIVGALLAYLFFNCSPASVFMGDTGSLSLGGFAACVCVFSGNALYLPIVGFVFVLSVISVIVQVIYYKVSKGKRIFLMAPIHHHFQKKGFSETKISYAYFILTLFLGVICILTSM